MSRFWMVPGARIGKNRRAVTVPKGGSNATARIVERNIGTTTPNGTDSNIDKLNGESSKDHVGSVCDYASNEMSGRLANGLGSWQPVTTKAQRKRETTDAARVSPIQLGQMETDRLWALGAKLIGKVNGDDIFIQRLGEEKCTNHLRH